MHSVVLLRMVPDVVEELEIAPGKTTLKPESVRLILSESDNHALEQALLLKESCGGTVTVLALASPEVDETLFEALAKGADRAIRIAPTEPALTTRHMASVFAQVIESEPDLKSADLILTGVRTIMDLDAPLAPLVARRLGRPHLGIVSRMSLDYSGRTITAIKEYPDGMRGEFEVRLPAVIGIQAAERSPRYAPVARVREARKTYSLGCVTGPFAEEAPLPPFEVLQIRRPRVAARAQMLAGAQEEMASKLRDVLVARGLVRGA